MASAQLIWCRGVQYWLEDPCGMPSEVEALPFVRLFIVLAGGRGARSEQEDVLIILLFSLSQRAASQAMQRRLLQDDKMCIVTSLQLYFMWACVRHFARSVVDALWYLCSRTNVASAAVQHSTSLFVCDSLVMLPNVCLFPSLNITLFGLVE